MQSCTPHALFTAIFVGNAQVLIGSGLAVQMVDLATCSTMCELPGLPEAVTAVAALEDRAAAWCVDEKQRFGVAWSDYAPPPLPSRTPAATAPSSCGTQ